MRLRVFDKNTVARDVELGTAMLGMAQFRDGAPRTVEVPLRGEAAGVGFWAEWL